MNPSYECMRRAREESRTELLEMRRWDVSQRLKALQLPESGSHDMLSRIAKVIYPTTTGWTREACDYLRDQLVDLIGGERDAQHGCSDGAGGCDCRHEQTPFVGYDVLGNERHKAVCNLLKIPDATGNFSFESHYFHVQNIFDALGIQEPCWARRVDALRDRLIHLLGGERDAQCGCAGGTDTCDCRHESEEVGGQSRTCPESGLDVSESDGGVSITSELREFVETYLMNNTTIENEKWLAMTGGNLLAIADRIDEQFARICEQQEKVLQDTIGEMQDEIERQRGVRDENAKVAEDAIHSSCMYLDLLRDAARDYKSLRDKLNKAFSVADHIQKKVDKLNREVSPCFDELYKMLDNVLDAATDPIDEFAYEMWENQ